MKKIAFSAVAVMAIVLASCGGKKSEAYEESDSVAIMEMVDIVAGERIPTLTKDSLGEVYVGRRMAELADSVPGLYSHKENGASPDAVTVTFSNADGAQFVAYDFGEGNVDVINLVGRDVAVSTPGGDVRLGDSFEKILSLPGVVAEWSGYDDSGSWYWTWEGIWFAPSAESLTPELSRVLYQSAEEPAADKFSDEVKIGFIGTGLPF